MWSQRHGGRHRRRRAAARGRALLHRHRADRRACRGNLPVLRVQDECAYYKEDAGKLLMGCFEPVAKPWGMEGIPDDFCFDSLPEDFDHFEPILEAAVRRVPALGAAGIALFFNGPESFTPDDRYYIGETPEVRDLFVATRLQLDRHRGERRRRQGARRLDPRPAPADGPGRRRRAPRHAVPGQPQLPARPHRRDAGPALRDALAVLPVRDRARCAPHAAARPAASPPAPAWARPRAGSGPTGTRRRARRPRYEYSYGRQNWFDACRAECEAVRDARGAVRPDLLRQVPGAGPRRLRRAEPAVDVERRRAGRPHRLHAVAQRARRHRGRPHRSRGWPSASSWSSPRPSARRATSPGCDAPSRRGRTRTAPSTDVTSGVADARRDGSAQPRTAAGSCRARTCRTPRIPSATRARSRSATRACARAASPTSANWAGSSTCRPSIASTCTSGCSQAGAPLGLTHAGYHAMGACRVEKGYQHWSHDIGDEDTPLDAGPGLHASPGTSPAASSAARRCWRRRPPARSSGGWCRSCSRMPPTTAPLLYHEEPIVRDGVIVGSIRSGAWGHRLGRSIGMGYVALRRRRHAGMAGGRAAGKSKWPAAGIPAACSCSLGTTRATSASGVERQHEDPCPGDRDRRRRRRLQCPLSPDPARPHRRACCSSATNSRPAPPGTPPATARISPPRGT